MAQYTILNIEAIAQILSQYNIFSIDSFRILSGGSENTNYLIFAEKEKYVLTICEQKPVQQTRGLALLLEHLASNHFSTSKVIRNIQGKAVATWQGKPVLLKNYLEGQILQDMPDHSLYLLGQELSKLHKINPPEFLPNAINYGINNFGEIAAHDTDFYNWLMGIKKMVEKCLSLNLPKTLIHGDIFYDNVIIGDEGNVTIMDFEEASHYYRVFDLGMILVGTCSRKEVLNLKKATSILEGYQKAIHLSEVEKDSLQTFTTYAAASMAFWRYKHFHYIQPDASMRHHYLKMKNLADHTRTLPEGAFKKLLN